MALMSAWMPAPPPESLPAMVRTLLYCFILLFISYDSYIRTSVAAVLRVLDYCVGVVGRKGEGLLIDKVAESALGDDCGLFCGSPPVRLLYELHGVGVLGLAAFHKRVVPASGSKYQIVNQSVSALLGNIYHYYSATRAKSGISLAKGRSQILHIAGAAVE